MIRLRVSMCVAVCIGLAIGNFGSQALGDSPDWPKAFDRVFFQTVAIGTVLLLARDKSKMPA